MNKKLWYYILTFLLCTGMLYAQSDITRGLKVKLKAGVGKRWAICIGINNYDDQNINKLKKSANDALGLSKVLKEKGDFDKIITYTDVDENGTERAFSSNSFPTKTKIEGFLEGIVRNKDIAPGDLVVFSFSGHGINDPQGNGYLLPIDWRSDKPYETAIALKMIENWLGQLGVKRSLLFFDACRKEMMSSKSFESKFKVFYEPKFEMANVLAEFFATKKGGYSYEDRNSNYGAFTNYVIKGLEGEGDKSNDGLVTFRELAGYVEDALTDWAIQNRLDQRPYIKLLDEQSGDLALTIAPRKISPPKPEKETPKPLIVEKPPEKEMKKITIEGLSLDELLTTANDAFTKGNYAGAKTVYEKLKQQMPDDKFINRKLQDCNDKLREIARQEEQRKMNEQELQKVPLYRTAMNDFLSSGDKKSAAEYAEKILKVLPGDREAKKVTAEQYPIPEMVSIPTGEFMMGSNDVEKPVHSVKVDAFYLGKYEVTQGEWTAVMGSNPSNFKGDDLPVECVNWNDVQEYLQKLSGITGKRWRLPTEAEWEYACRAGSTKKYCFGDDITELGEYAWYDNNSGKKTHPVGQKKPNAWGLYDMHGNVWEWCHDWYDKNYYANSPLTNPTGPSAGQCRVLRGGSWINDTVNQRSADRYYTFYYGLYPYDRLYYLGFRCLQEP